MKIQVLLLVSSTLFPWFVAPETNCESADEASCQSHTGTAMLQKETNKRVLSKAPDESAEGGSTMTINVPVSSVKFNGAASAKPGVTSSSVSGVVPRIASNYALYTYRIDPTGKAPLLVNPGKMIFKQEMLNKTSSIADRRTKTSTMMSESLETADKNFASSLSLKVEAPVFSGSASASSTMMSKSKIRKIRSDHMIQCTVYKISNNAVSPHTFLAEDWKDFLLKKTPEEIVDKIGEFYATEVVMGGVFRASLLKEVKKTESAATFKAEIEAKGPLSIPGTTVSGTASSSGSTKNTKDSSRITKSTESQGGDPTVWLGLTKTNQDEIQKKWADTVNDATLAVTELKLRPIWELLDKDDMDKKRADLLKGWLLTKWIKEGQNAIDFSAFPYADAGFTLDQPKKKLTGDMHWMWSEERRQKNADKGDAEIVDACYRDVLLHNECSKDYFQFVARGDKNCGCKKHTGDDVETEDISDIYKTQIAANFIQIFQGQDDGQHSTLGLNWDDKAPHWRVSFYALTTGDYPNTKKISFAKTDKYWSRVIEGGLQGLPTSDYPHDRNEIWVYDNWVPGTWEFSVGRYDAWGTDNSIVSIGNKENHAKCCGKGNHDTFSFWAYCDNWEAVAP